MMRTNRLFNENTDNAGGTATIPDTAPASNPDPQPPATPPSPSPQAMKLTGDTVLDADLARELGFEQFAGKPLANAFESYKAMMARSTKAEQEAKKAREQVEALQKQVKEAPKALPQEEGEPLDVQAALTDYYDKGEVDSETVANIAERLKAAGLNVTPQFVANAFETARAARTQLFTAAKEYTGDLEPTEVIAWLEGGESGYTQEALNTFNQLFEDGDASWMSGVTKRYNAHIEKGGKRANLPGQQPEPRTDPNSMLRGRPPMAEQPGFKSRAEAFEFMEAAEGNSAKMAEYHAKLKASNTERWPDKA